MNFYIQKHKRNENNERCISLIKRSAFMGIVVPCTKMLNNGG